MRFTIDQNLKQTLGYRYYPTLIGSLRILSASAFELEEIISEQMLSNPCLEWKNSYRPLTEYNYELIQSDIDPKEDLLYQLHISNVNQVIGEYMIESLDVHGFLKESDETIARVLGVSKQAVRETRKSIQQFEPRGIASNSLEEFLLMQLNPKDSNYKKLKYALKHLSIFVSKDFAKISKELKCSVEEAKEIYTTIANLKPYPIDLSRKDSMVLFPDVTIEMEGDEVAFRLFEFSEQFEVKEYLIEENDETARYLQRQLKEAKVLQKNCMKRSQTLFRIMKVIVDVQKDYLQGGELKPLTYQMIADETHFNVSTVYRALQHKSYEMDGSLVLISSLLSKESVEDHSKVEVQNKLKELIETEDVKHPLSDQQLAILMEEEYGITIARRTISKYRMQLRILPSSKRKVIRAKEDS